MDHVTIGTHNLEDEQGIPTFFADVVFFTEAVPRRIRDRLAGLLGRARARHRARLSGIRIIRATGNRSLAIAFPTSWLELVSKEYHRAHGGRAGVTPGRGTFVAKCRTRDTDRKVALIDEHRINAAFPPFVRGEALFRAGCWEKHTELTLRLADQLELEGYLVLIGGDPNTPRDVPAYQGELREAGAGKDRLGCTKTARLTGATHYSGKGSDHRRFLATVHLPKEYR